MIVAFFYLQVKAFHKSDYHTSLGRTGRGRYHMVQLTLDPSTLLSWCKVEDESALDQLFSITRSLSLYYGNKRLLAVYRCIAANKQQACGLAAAASCGMVAAVYGQLILLQTRTESTRTFSLVNSYFFATRTLVNSYFFFGQLVLFFGQLVLFLRSTRTF